MVTISEYQLALKQRGEDIASAESQVKAFNPQLQRTVQQIYRQTPSDVSKMKTLEYQRAQQKEQVLTDISKANAETAQMEQQLQGYLGTPSGIVQYAQEYNIQPTIQMVSPGVTSEGAQIAPVPVYTYTTPYGTYVDDSAVKAAEQSQTIQSLVYESGTYSAKSGAENKLASSLTPAKLAALTGTSVEKTTGAFAGPGYEVQTPYGSISTQYPDAYTTPTAPKLSETLTKDLSRVAALQVPAQAQLDYVTGLTRPVTYSTKGITGMVSLASASDGKEISIKSIKAPVYAPETPKSLVFNPDDSSSGFKPKDINILPTSSNNVKLSSGLSSGGITGSSVLVDGGQSASSKPSGFLSGLLAGIKEGAPKQETYVPGVKAFGTVSAAGEKASLEFKQPTLVQSEKISYQTIPRSTDVLGYLPEKAKIFVEDLLPYKNYKVGVFNLPEQPIYTKSTLVNFGQSTERPQFIYPSTTKDININPAQIAGKTAYGLTYGAELYGLAALGAANFASLAPTAYIPQVLKNRELTPLEKVGAIGGLVLPELGRISKSPIFMDKITKKTMTANIKEIEPIFVQRAKKIETTTLPTGEPVTKLTYDIKGGWRPASSGEIVQVYSQSPLQRLKSKFFGTTEKTDVYSGNPFKDMEGYNKAKDLLTGKLYNIESQQWIKVSPKEAGQMIAAKLPKLIDASFKGEGVVLIGTKEKPQIAVSGRILEIPKVVKEDIWTTRGGTAILTKVSQKGEILEKSLKFPELSRALLDAKYTKMFLTPEGRPFSKLSQRGRTTELFRQVSAARGVGGGMIQIFPKPLPKSEGVIEVWHATSSKNVPGILEKGLLPSSKSGTYQGIVKPLDFVSTGTTPDVKGFGLRAVAKQGGEIAVVKATIPKEVAERLIVKSDKLSGVGELRFKEIPAKYLSLEEKNALTIGKEFPAKIFKEASAFKKEFPSGRLGKTQGGKSTIISLETNPPRMNYEPPFKVTYEPIKPAETPVMYDQKWYQGLAKDLKDIYGKQIQQAKTIAGSVSPIIPTSKLPAIKPSIKPSAASTFSILPLASAASTFSILPLASAASATSIYAGTGQYELTSGGLLPGFKPSISGRAIQDISISPKPALDLGQVIKPSTDTIQIPNVFVTPVIVPKPSFNFREGQRQQEPQVQIPKIVQALIPRIRQETPVTPKPVVTIQPPKPRPEPPRKLKPRFEFNPKEDSGKISIKRNKVVKPTLSYIPEIKKGGKFIAIGTPTTKGRALLTGAKAVSQTLAATFRARPVNVATRDTEIGYIPSSQVFRAPKGKSIGLTFVQRKGITEGAPIGSGGRLSSFGERAAITRARKSNPSLRVKAGKFFKIGGKI